MLGLLSACTGKKTALNDKQAYSLMPVPVTVHPGKGYFELQEKTKITINDGDKDMHALASYLSDKIHRLVNRNVQVSNDVDTESVNTIRLVLDKTLSITDTIPPSAQKEAYTLIVTPEQVIVRGKSHAALFYGVQTFLQLLFPNDQAGIITIPATEIHDYPAYTWRGLHMDVCRHFFSVEFIKKMIDAMAMHKMNTFHWHLTDDQGWRIEIKKYP
ncbi:MAG TPA: family 20 glycosylhydrolase, partial [Bacteroidia bacterium]|nr:family 20 glycosylhydrolase [Bacteroidia bacterium]